MTKGSKHTPEAIEKLRIASTGTTRALGHIVSQEARERISRAKKGKPSSSSTKFKKGERIGPDHPRWKGGIENTRFLHRRREAMKKGAEGSHTFGEWETLKAQYNWVCPACKRGEPEIKLTQDHIIPLVRGGSDNIENIQPLCASCNSKKHDKLIPRYEI